MQCCCVFCFVLFVCLFLFVFVCCQEIGVIRLKRRDGLLFHIQHHITHTMVFDNQSRNTGCNKQRREEEEEEEDEEEAHCVFHKGSNQQPITP